MRYKVIYSILFFVAACTAVPKEPLAAEFLSEPAAYKAMRMDWWRQARFGLFIHWGIYSVPAGQWGAKSNLGEWIRSEAQIADKDYDAFAEQFNPVRFDAAAWVAAAKMAGVKYLVITSKHHDGFCMFDSALTEYDIMDASPFKRDVLIELSEECLRQGIKFCVYYSILDWHHPDYQPQPEWQKRPCEGADFNRYVDYMKGQLKEIVTQYHPAVLWFDGEWDKTWTEEIGREVYGYVRSLKPDIIINNRVGKGRQGMGGIYDPNTAVGDFGTPEQEIPARGLAYDWETCMTMNDHWGWNAADKNYKSAQDLIEKIVDIASKGGNFLLNVGPTAEGTFPAEAVERLAAIGSWMRIHGDSIYSTTASRFQYLPFGRSTTKDNRIYLHIFNWPKDGRIVLPGVMSNPVAAAFLKDPNIPIGITLEPMAVVLAVPDAPTESLPAVIELEFKDVPEITYGPDIFPKAAEFSEPIDIAFGEFMPENDYRIYYTLDGSDPNTSSCYYEEPFTLRDSAIISCQKIDSSGSPLSPVSRKVFVKKPSEQNGTGKP